MNEIKISGSQVFWMIGVMEYGMSALLTIAPAISKAKQDAWISFLIAGGIAVFVAFVATKLSLLYPGQTLVEYSQTILGKWLGKMIIVPYFIQWYTAIGIILRQSSELIAQTELPRTPMWVLIVSMTLVVMWATYEGIEVIGRCSEFLGIGIILLAIFLTILILPDVEWGNLLPVFSAGVTPILEGALPPASFLGECVMMMMLLPFMREPKEGPSKTVWAVGFASLFLTLSTVMVLAVFGPMSAKMWYPAFELVRYISIAEFLERMDSLIIAVWLTGVFVKLSLYFFITCYGTAQWMGIKNWRKTILFVAPIVALLALVPRNVDQASVVYPQKFWMPFVFPINIIGIPLLLWIAGTIRKKKEAQSFE